MSRARGIGIGKRGRRAGGRNSWSTDIHATEALSIFTAGGAGMEAVAQIPAITTSSRATDGFV